MIKASFPSSLSHSLVGTITQLSLTSASQNAVANSKSVCCPASALRTNSSLSCPQVMLAEVAVSGVIAFCITLMTSITT